MRQIGIAFIVAIAMIAAPPMAESAHHKNPCSVKNPCGVKNPCSVKNPCGVKNPCSHKNPCGVKNPCSHKNPCGVKNPCSHKNPCGVKNPCSHKNPCGVKNPCNPCGGSAVKSIRNDNITDKKALLKKGEALWVNENLGKSGLACATCHADYENLNLDNKEEYPRFVKMATDIVTLDQMINFCMINPVEGKPLDPNSIEMTAMNAWYREFIKGYKGN